MPAQYLVASRVKEFASKADLRVSSEVMDTVNDRVEKILKEAAERAKANGRKTIKSYDI
jgi:histone H3/H4